MYEFHTGRPVTLSAKVRSGSLAVTAEEREGVVVRVEPNDGSDASRQQAENTLVEMRGDTLVIHAPEPAGWIWRRGSIRVTAQVPLDSAFECHVASADVVLAGLWREGSLNTASGDVRIESVTGNLRVNTASGDVFAARVGGDARVNSASGDVEVGSLGGDATLHSASGDLRVLDTGGSVQARTASGDIDLLRARRGELRGTTASGDVTVTVLPGTGVYMDVRTASGSTHSDLDVGGEPPADRKDPAATLSVRVQTVSGDVSVLRAAVSERSDAAGRPANHT
jgi:DUF4097 and DUF4098 domain-containing protein YvlB